MPTTYFYPRRIWWLCQRQPIPNLPTINQTLLTIVSAISSIRSSTFTKIVPRLASNMLLRNTCAMCSAVGLLLFSAELTNSKSMPQFQHRTLVTILLIIIVHQHAKTFWVAYLSMTLAIIHRI